MLQKHFKRNGCHNETNAIVPELLLLAPGMGLQRAQCAFLKEVKKNQKVRAKHLQKSFDHKMFSKILKSKVLVFIEIQQERRLCPHENIVRHVSTTQELQRTSRAIWSRQMRKKENLISI